MGIGGKEHRALTGLLLLLFALLAFQAWDTGVTMDEPNHMLGAHFYWGGGAIYHVPDLAPLLKIVSGWVPRSFGIPIPGQSDPRWQTRDEWAAAAAWAVDLKDPMYRRMTTLFRLPMLLFPLATVFLIWHWGREAFGPWPALAGAAIFAFEPTALGHGALLKNDVACAFAYLAYWYAAWRFWRAPAWNTVLWLTAATLIGVLAKLSLIILAGLAPLILLSRPSRRTPAYLAAFATLLYLGVCTAYLWDVRLLHPVEIVHKWADPKIPGLFTFVGQIFQWIPVPAYFWEGCVGLFWGAADRPPVYLWGTVRHTADPLYFLLALAVKVPVGYQILFLTAALAAVWDFVKRRDPLLLFLLFPPVLYIGLASFSGLQLGIRLILPALPFAALLAARVAADWRRFVLAAACLGVLESLVYFPHGIAFFNMWAGGPKNGIEYLADSNLDWGQDLRRLRDWYRENGNPKFKLAYFGADTPWRYFLDTQIESTPPPWNENFAKGQTVLQPEPAIYAISATLLPGHFFKSQYQDYYKHFRELKPNARAGWSILIYDLRSAPRLKVEEIR